jgi:hypothetical protein
VSERVYRIVMIVSAGAVGPGRAANLPRPGERGGYHLTLYEVALR